MGKRGEMKDGDKNTVEILKGFGCCLVMVRKEQTKQAWMNRPKAPNASLLWVHPRLLLPLKLVFSLCSFLVQMSQISHCYLLQFPLDAICNLSKHAQRSTRHQTENVQVGCWRLATKTTVSLVVCCKVCENVFGLLPPTLPHTIRLIWQYDFWLASPVRITLLFLFPFPLWSK